VLPAVEQRAAGFGGEIVSFNETQAIAALEAVIKRKPAIVAFERIFAMTPRGAALINRIKADPKLKDTEVRVVAHDSDYSRVSPRAAGPGAKALDQTGTRRAPRFKMAEKTDISIDGKSGMLIDLSTIGAQLVSQAAVKPNQELKLILTDVAGNVKFLGKVVWASFEIPPNGTPRYRAGAEFLDADATAIDAFIQRHKVPPA
jgi:predicted regulator of Ras-like GTPase activity (Roadblock/LC7/MglB family)